MKINLPVNNAERKLREGEVLISTTDLKGVITCANDAFVEISGFTKEELIGANHNVVRHPDMPVEAFAELWSKLKDGKPWMGIVKNRAKDGSYYWVDAYVTPMYEGSQVVGYQSVRVKAEDEYIRRAEKLYAKINAGKKDVKKVSNLRIHGIRYCLRAALYPLLPMLASVGVAYAAFDVSGLAASLLAASSIVSAGILAAHLKSTIIEALGNARDVFDSRVASYVYTGRVDEIGLLELSRLAVNARLRTLAGRVEEVGHMLYGIAQDVVSEVEVTSGGVGRQHSETDMVATAANEMAAAVQEVAKSTSDAASGASEGLRLGGEANLIVTEAVAAITVLESEMTNVFAEIEKVNGGEREHRRGC